MRPRDVAWIAAAACVLCLPYAFVTAGGDSLAYFNFIQCFSGQMWQGDPYPRWCFEADAGLGSPLFFFYFPLPFYITSLFYPLVWAGAGIQTVFGLSMGLATFVSGLTCRQWLRQWVSGRSALAAAIVYMFLPYRLSVTLYGWALAEAWCLALLPLLCLCAERLAAEVPVRPRWVLATAAVTALMLLCHVQVTGCALIGVGIYLAVLARRSSPLAALLGAAGIAALADSFYAWPAYHFLSFVDARNVPYPWANRVVTAVDFTQDQVRVLTGAGISLLALAALAAAALAGKRKIAEPGLRRACIAWLAASALALLLLAPASGPFWAGINRFGPLAYPWRMQLVFMLALAFVSAACMEHVFALRKTRMGDYAAALGLLFFFGLFLLHTRTPQQIAHLDEVLASRYIMGEEYRTQWTQPRFAGVSQEAYDFIMAHQRDRGSMARVAVVRGQAEVTIKQWDWRGIVLDVVAKKASLLRLQHRYFPCWQAYADFGGSAGFAPEHGTGLMRLAVPKGHHLIRIMRVL